VEVGSHWALDGSGIGKNVGPISSYIHKARFGPS
jgi:hypothetical protein